MKKNDAGDFCVLYIEPSDERAALFPVIAGQRKPVVLILTDQVNVFQRPDDFTALKHLKRQQDMLIIFIIPQGGQMAQQAAKNGFPVYLSIDNLTDAVNAGQLVRQRMINRAASPMSHGGQANSAKITIPLSPASSNGSQPKKTPLLTTQTASTSQLSQKSRISQPLPAQKISRPLPPRESYPSGSMPTTSRLEQNGRFPLLLVVLTFVLVIGVVGSFLVVPRLMPPTAPPPLTTVGHLAYVSSNQVSENSSQGIADQIVLDLHNLSTPHPQKRFYAWLLSDKGKSDPKSIALGAIQVNNGSAHLVYPGDSQHTNLLQITSRFLVTEEDASIPPLSPSPDTSTWRYYGEFSSTPIQSPENPKHFSYLDHLRHLLASDPTLNDLELPGGLNNWTFRNTGKIFEWASSTRENWEETRDSAFVRRMAIRILEYLDGTTFLYKDLPKDTPLLVNERLARVGLLAVDGPNQDPPGYLGHIDHHLQGLLQAGHASDTLRKQMSSLMAAMNDIEFWLNQVHTDAARLVKMSDDQLRQPSTLDLLNDMIDNANHAYAGQQDTTTNTTRPGALWLHMQMQSLATIDVIPVTHNMTTLAPPIVWGTGRPWAFTPFEANK